MHRFLLFANTYEKKASTTVRVYVPKLRPRTLYPPFVCEEYLERDKRQLVHQGETLDVAVTVDQVEKNGVKLEELEKGLGPASPSSLLAVVERMKWLCITYKAIIMHVCLMGAIRLFSSCGR